MFARILAVLALLGLVAVGWFATSLLSGARELDTQPVWPSKDLEPFRIRADVAGAWDVHWDDVPGAQCMGLLWFRTDPPVRELKDGTRILARIHPGRDEWLLLGPEWDEDSAVKLDLRTLQRIEYRVERAGDQLADRRCELTVCGNCDSKSGMYATTLRSYAIIAAFALGVPLLTILVLACVAIARSRKPRA